MSNSTYIERDEHDVYPKVPTSSERITELVITVEHLDKEIERLKMENNSLKEEHQKLRWKPTEKQMDALYAVIPHSGQPVTLQSLYHDLKKLM